MSPGYSAVQTAELVSALRWACGRLSEIFEAWAMDAAAAAAGGAPGADREPERSDHDAGATAFAVEMTVLSRRLAAHRDVLDGLQPDSERLAAWRQATPADASVTGALDEIAAMRGTTERLAVARDVLVPQLLGAYRDIGDHAAPHCDAALATAAGSLSHDLDRNRPGDAAPHTPESSEAAAAAESRLAKVGGVVGRSLLRPAAWA